MHKENSEKIVHFSEKMSDKYLIEKYLNKINQANKLSELYQIRADLIGRYMILCNNIYPSDDFADNKLQTKQCIDDLLAILCEKISTYKK